MTDRDYYETLGVAPSSSPEEISQAFHRLAREYHPDLHPDDQEAAAQFKQINAAYQTLSDADRRAQYDQERANKIVEIPWSATPQPEPAQDTQEFVYQRSVALDGEDIESALDEFRSALTDTANEVADELRGALRDFATELDALTRAAARLPDDRPRRPGFPPPPPRRGPPARRR